MSAVDNLLKLVGGVRDGALLRFSLGTEYLKCGEPALAVEQLRAAVGFDPKYSAAWKLLGKALEADDQAQEALAAYAQGIDVANARGDIQAVKEMRVFVRRIERQLAMGKPS